MLRLGPFQTKFRGQKRVKKQVCSVPTILLGSKEKWGGEVQTSEQIFSYTQKPASFKLILDTWLFIFRMN